MNERTIRICFVCTHSFTLATLYKGLFPYLRQQGYEIDVVVGDDEYTHFDPKLFGELHPFVVPMQRLPHFGRDLVSLARFVVFFLRHRYDIIHVSTPKASLLASISAKLTCNGKVIFLHRRLVYQMMTGAKRRLLRESDRITAAFSDLVVPVSRQIRAVLVEEGLAPARKVRVIGSGGSNGTDIMRFSPCAVSAVELADLRCSLGIPDRALVLVYVGRVSGEKGVDLLPKVLDEVRARRPECLLVVAGPDDARDPPAPETHCRFSDDPAIRRIGFVANPSPLYALADVFVFPSYFEGIANVLLECAAHERVAVAFEVPGTDETIKQGETGFLVRKGDTAAMAAAIIQVLEDPDLRRTIEINARERVAKEFSNEVVWSGLDRTLRELIGRPVNEK